jgi:conjugal transfer pilus assembly protein TraF
MKPLHRVIVTAALGLTCQSGSAGIDYPSVWECDRSKFNWYCDVDVDVDVEMAPLPKPPRPVESKTREEEALERLETWQKELKGKRALSILEPTPENVRAYIEAQEKQMQTASVYSDVWRRVIWQNPDLNYELTRPVNNAAIATYTHTRKSAEKRTLDEINKEWGLFFFFRSDCPYCHRLAPTLKFLGETYGITVLPVSVDGGGLPDYPNPQRDNGLAEKLAMREVPMLVLGNIKDKRLIPLASGVISAQDVIERIYVLTSTQPGDLY